MARRDRPKAPQAEETFDVPIPQAVEIAPAPAAKPAEENAYTVGRWAGLPNYTCTQCPYSTLEEPMILEHVREHR